jgi:regulator of protease activity HflC (stomatin/prohibitin superfamily)
MIVTMIVGGVGVVILVLIASIIAGTFYMVPQQSFAIEERFGKYKRITAPGLRARIPFIDKVTNKISIRVTELNVRLSTKTLDNVIVELLIAVQYFVEKDNVWKANYMLTTPKEQMESYIFDAVRAKVPSMTLDEVFEKKDDIAMDVQEKLRETMPEYGYSIKTALVNDIQPDAKVAIAMNEINAQQRYQLAAEYKGEAEKILVVKAAEADAKSKELSGQGIAAQRIAIVEGLKVSIQDFEKGTGVSAQEVMSLVLLTQYYDMLTSVGQNSKTNTIMIPHSPDAVGNLRNQIAQSILLASPEQSS